MPSEMPCQGHLFNNARPRVYLMADGHDPGEGKRLRSRGSRH